MAPDWQVWANEVVAASQRRCASVMLAAASYRCAEKFPSFQSPSLINEIYRNYTSYDDHSRIGRQINCAVRCTCISHLLLHTNSFLFFLRLHKMHIAVKWPQFGVLASSVSSREFHFFYQLDLFAVVDCRLRRAIQCNSINYKNEAEKIKSIKFRNGQSHSRRTKQMYMQFALFARLCFVLVSNAAIAMNYKRER